MVSLDSLCKPFSFHFSSFFCCYVAIAPLGLVVKACFQVRSSLKRKHFCLQHVLFILFHVKADIVHDLESTALQLRIIQKLVPKSLAFKLCQSRTNKQYLNKVIEIKYNFTEVWEWNPNHKNQKSREGF